MKFFILASILIISVQSLTPCSATNNTNGTNGTNSTNITYFCPERSTCCQVNNTFGCCPGVNSTCCSDGSSCCPASTICDLRNRRCIPKTSLFLAYLEETSSQAEAVVLSSAQQFIEGFVNGTGALNSLPSYQTCHPLNETLVASVQEFVAALGNVTLENFEQELVNLVAIGHDILDGVANNYASCPQAVNETLALGANLLNFVSQPGYFTNVTNHFSANLFNVVSRANNIQQLLNQGNHYLAGVEAGNTFNFIFLYYY
jgi:hypothetical protein